MDTDTSKEEEGDEGIFGSDNLSSALLEPVTSEAEIDYSLVYALFTFVASMEGQISVLKGEALELLDDSNSYWWAVKCLSSEEIGYIPAENIETPHEKLARFNRSRNVEIASVKANDVPPMLKKEEKVTKIKFAEYVTEIYEEEVPDAVQPPLQNDQENQDTISDLKKTSKPKSLDPSAKRNSQRSSIIINTTAVSLGNDAEQKKEIKRVETPTDKKPRFLDRFFKPLRMNSQSNTVRNKSSEESVNSAGSAQSNNSPKDLERNILRVFAGPNTELNGTFKSVSFDKDTLVGDLVINTLKKFRTSHEKGNDLYYLTVTSLENSNNGEKKLNVNENINTVLDYYGLASFNNPYPQKTDNPSDDRIRITIMKYPDPFKMIPIFVCFENNSTLCQIEVPSTATVQDIIRYTADFFNADPKFGFRFRLLHLFDQKVLDPTYPVKILAQVAATKNQRLEFQLLYGPRKPVPQEPISTTTTTASTSDYEQKRKVSSLDPGRPIDLLQDIPPPTPPEDAKTPLSEKAAIRLGSPIRSASPSGGRPNSPSMMLQYRSRESSLPSQLQSKPLDAAPQPNSKPITKAQPESPKVGYVQQPVKPTAAISVQRNSGILYEYDRMLQSLDISIKRTQSVPVDVYEILGNLEKDLDGMIQGGKGLKRSASANKSRLSQLYNLSFAQKDEIIGEEEEEVDGDFDLLLLKVKESSNEFTRLESRLNGMLSYLLFVN